MNAGNFFDFDTAVPPDDPDQFHEEGGDEYDVLNEETFGSAAVELDWEEGHEKFANLTRAQKNLTRNNEFRQKLNANILEPNEIRNLERDLSSLYTKRGNEASNVLDSSILADYVRPSIPGKSIWSYDSSLKDQSVLSPNRANSLCSNMPEKIELSRTFPPPPIRTPVPFSSKFKMVAELESEMKANQLLRQLGPNNNTMPSRVMEANFANRLPYRQFLPLNSNIRNGMIGNYGNFADQLKHGPRPPPNHFMMQPRPMQGVPNAFNNIRPQWGPNMVVGNIFNQRFPHQRTEIHNFPRNVSHFSRSHFISAQNDQRYFDNSHYNQQQNYRDRPKDDLDAEWEEWRRIKQNDPYAGLLNPKEKAWLKNIETKQHASENPYEDDYYYVMLNLKKQKRKDQEIVKVNGVQLMADKARDGKYVPPKMANSLGKLQVVSVNAPRKIIDLPSLHTESSGSAAPLQKELKKKRHVMMYIEKLCNIQIELDDLERKARGLPDCPTRDSYKSKFNQLISKLWNAVTVSESTLTQIFLIRKGRYLMSHLLDWLDEAQLSIFFGIIFENLSTIMNEDEDYLVTFWIQLDRFIANASQKHLLQLVDKLDCQLCTEVNHNAAILSCKQFGLSVVITLMIRGEVLWSVMEENEEWPKFLNKAVHTLANFYRSNAVAVLPSLFITAALGHIRTQVNRCSVVDKESLKSALDATVLIESLVR